MDDQRTDRNSGELKSSQHILAHMLYYIGHMHKYPAMYTGVVKGEPGAVEAFDAAMLSWHGIWSELVSRNEDFSNARYAVYDRHKLLNSSFHDAYRRKYKKRTEDEVFEFVRQCWREIDEELGIDLAVPEPELNTSDSTH